MPAAGSSLEAHVRRLLFLHCSNGAASGNPELPFVWLLREAIVSVRQRLPFWNEGWDLLPDHLHLIRALPNGDANFSNRWHLIKGHVVRVCGPGYLLGQHRSANQCGTLWTPIGLCRPSCTSVKGGRQVSSTSCLAALLIKNPAGEGRVLCRWLDGT